MSTERGRGGVVQGWFSDLRSMLSFLLIGCGDNVVIDHWIFPKAWNCHATSLSILIWLLVIFSFMLIGQGDNFGLQHSIWKLSFRFSWYELSTRSVHVWTEQNLCITNAWPYRCNKRCDVFPADDKVLAGFPSNHILDIIREFINSFKKKIWKSLASRQ